MTECSRGAHRLLKQHSTQPELRLADTVREQPIMAETLEAFNVVHCIRHEDSMGSPQAESPRIGMSHTVGAAHRIGLN